MKKSLLVFILHTFIYFSALYSQNADPSIAITLNSSSIQIGNTTILNVAAGNYSNGTILANTLRVAVSVGLDAEILGFATGSDPRWTIVQSSTGPGNTYIFKNTGGSFGSFDIGNIRLNVKGVLVSQPDLILGNIVYITGNNPALGGAPNSAQGNLSITNDNAQTPLSVTTGNPDPYISIIMNSATIPLHNTSTLAADAGNVGNSNILVNTVKATLHVGNNAEIMGLAPNSDSRWTISFLSSGAGNTVILTNTGGSFTAFDLGSILLNVKGITVSPATVITGNIAYVVANNPALGGALNSTQGNASVTNDDAQTSLTVTGIALPIELLNFKATPSVSSNLLTWETANEINNKGFQVERLQTTGNDKWDILGFVWAKDKSATYDYDDTAPLTTSYYRLRQLDNDGKEIVSKVISVSNSYKNTLKIYPSVVTNILNIETSETESNFIIINLLGQQIMNGKVTESIDVSNLPNGTYIIKIGAEQAKFLKQ